MRVLFARFVKPLFVAVRGAVVAALERRAGIRTGGVVGVGELDAPEHAVEYKPSAWTTLRRALSPRAVGADDVFIDIGCGKGRVVCQAAMRYRFARVIGIDADRRLVAQAQHNVDAIRGRMRARDVVVETADATTYPIPDDVTVVYLYNPFRGPVFAAVVQAIIASQQRRPRRVRVIYVTPLEEQALLDAGFRVVRRLRGMRPGAEWSRSNSTVLFERDPRSASAR